MLFYLCSDLVGNPILDAHFFCCDILVGNSDSYIGCTPGSFVLPLSFGHTQECGLDHSDLVGSHLGGTDLPVGTGLPLVVAPHGVRSVLLAPPAD